jgi:hypothetical protein
LWNNWRGDCELHQHSWVFVIIESHCSVILIITLVIKQSDPHLVSSVKRSVKENGSWNTDTSDVWFIILDIFDDQNHSGILIVGIIFKLESKIVRLDHLSTLLNHKHVNKGATVLNKATDPGCWEKTFHVVFQDNI